MEGTLAQTGSGGALGAAGRGVLLLALVCAGVCLGAVGQRSSRGMAQYVERGLTDRDGLPQNSVQAIAQTRDGYLWFGTQEGLARYDGARVTVFDTIQHPEMKDNYVLGLTAGRDGSLWIATRTALTRLRNGQFTSYLMARSPIATVVETRDGRVWAGALEGLYAVDPRHAEAEPRLYTTADGLPSNDVNAMAEDAAGRLWVGTGRGLARLVEARAGLGRAGSGRVGAGGVRAGRFETDLAGGDAGEAVHLLAACGDGSLWIAGRSLVRWRDGAMVETAPAEAMGMSVVALLPRRDGSLWLGYEHGGLARLWEGRLERYTAAQGLLSDDVAALIEDRDGHLWAGLAESGAVQLREGLFSSLGKREGLSENMVWSVLRARDGSMWVGTNSRGLNHVLADGRVEVWTTREGLGGNSIYGLHEGRDGSLWVGGEDGWLGRIQGKRVRVYRDSAAAGRLTTILDAPGDDGKLVLAMHQVDGLALFDPGTGRFEHYKVPGLLNTATVAPDGSVWVGADHSGVSRVRLASGGVRSYTTVDGLLTNFAQAVYVDRDGVVWAGTSPGGLNRIKDGRITTYSLDEGLFDLTVGAIVEDGEGYLWMTCNKGIYKVRKKELNDFAEGRVKEIHSIVYTDADGLRSVECNFAADPSVAQGEDGRLWFATTAGVASIDPRESEVHAHVPPVLIEAVRYDQRPVRGEGNVTTGPGHGNLEIEYTAPDFVAAQRIRFRYRLEGADVDWVEAGDRRQAFYTKLTPGKYRFLVQAAVGDEAWKNGVGEARLVVLLKPQIWETAWFRGLCLLALLAGIVLAVRMQMRNYVARNRMLEERVNERTAELKLAIEAAEAAHHALRDQASHDGLTGLWNRRSVFEMLSRELRRAEREGQTVALLLADVDHFKTVNDTHGHLVGDGVLQQVATRLDVMTRSYDFAGRYGGEEFLVVLPHCGLADAVRRAEEFRGAIGGTPMMTNVGPLSVTCSIGVAVSAAGMTAEALMHNADDAMYSAKRAGRNRVFAFTALGSAEAVVKGQGSGTKGLRD